MSATRTITFVGEAELVEFDDGGKMNKFPVTLDDGSESEAWRPVGNKWPPKVGDEGTVEGTKFKKLPKDGGSASGSYSGGGKSNSGEFRSPDQLMRGYAAAAAAEVSSNVDELLAAADRIYVWVKGDDAPPPAQSMPEGHGTGYDENDLQAAKQQLQQHAANNEWPLTLIGEAIQKVCGHPQLQVADIDKMDEILAEAKALYIPF